MAFKFSPCLPCCDHCSFCIQPRICDGVINNSLSTQPAPTGMLVLIYDVASGVDRFEFSSLVGSGYTYSSGFTDRSICFNGHHANDTPFKYADKIGVIIRGSGYFDYSGIQPINCSTYPDFIQKDEPRQIDFVINTCSPISGSIFLSGVAGPYHNLFSGDYPQYTYTNTLPCYGSGSTTTFSGLPFAGSYYWKLDFSDPGYNRQPVTFSGNITVCTIGRLTQTINPNYSGGWLCCFGDLIYGPDWQYVCTSSCGTTTYCTFKTALGGGLWEGTSTSPGKILACIRQLNPFVPGDTYFCGTTEADSPVHATVSCSSAGVTFPMCLGSKSTYKTDIEHSAPCSGGMADDCWSNAHPPGYPAGLCTISPNGEYHKCEEGFQMGIGGTPFYHIDRDGNYVWSNGYADSYTVLVTGSGCGLTEDYLSCNGRKALCGDSWNVSATRIPI